MAVGQVAEVLSRHGQYLTLTGISDREGHHPHQSLQQIGAMASHMGQQQLAHVALAGAMAEEQHRIGALHGLQDPVQVVGISGGPLARDVTVVTMAEILSAPPESMGHQHGMLHPIPLQQKGIGAVVIQVNHQPAALIPTGAR
ncbi:MAG: hypothetical protein ACK56F_00340, partial [bacterium]